MDIGSPTYLRYGVLVSILVLVERPFGLDDRHPEHPGHVVSILVLVERPFGHPFLFLFSKRNKVSILVLVERPFGPRVCPTGSGRMSVSILVLVERPFGHRTVNVSESEIEFQSLFWWRGHLDLAVQPTRRHHRSFNPCFGGEAIWTGGLDALTYSGVCFNPCFGGEAIWTSGGARATGAA